MLAWSNLEHSSSGSQQRLEVQQRLQAPDNWGKDEKSRHRILFPLGNISLKEIMEYLGSPTKEVETITLGSRVIYSSVSKNHIQKSVLRKFPATPAYQQVTIRNQNTVYKLIKLFEDI